MKLWRARGLATGLTVIYLALVYAVVIEGPGALLEVGGQTDRRGALSVLATVIVAATFEPVRERARRLANRAVHGVLVTPYELIATIGSRMAQTLSLEDVPLAVAEAAARAVRAESARVRVLLAGGEARVATWPSARPTPASTAGTRDPETRALPVVHGGELVGEVIVVKAPGEAFTPVDARLLDTLAAQAGIALHNVRLTLELEQAVQESSAQAEALRASQARILTAGDRERQRLEHEITTRVSRELDRARRDLKAAIAMLPDAPADASGRIERAAGRATSALDVLREIAHGVFPPMLQARGLIAALRAHILRLPLTVTLRADVGRSTSRFDVRAEAAIYFCCVEILRAAQATPSQPDVTISIGRTGGFATFTVTQPGLAISPDAMQAMGDRIEALDGHLDHRARGAMVEVKGRVPAVLT